MLEVKVNDADIRKAAAEGEDAFIAVFVAAIRDAIGGEITAENIESLSADQITLLAWAHLHEEVMEGGYVQLIHNGFGAFIFKNPFAVAMRNWGLTTLYSHIRRTKKFYDKYHAEIERDMNDEDFMALYEQMPEFDDQDDDFIVNEEAWTQEIATYVDEHLADFVTITQG